MAFKELSGSTGPILKWETPGQSVEGRLVATKRGKVFNNKPSTLAIIKQSDGVDVTVPLPTALESRFLESGIVPGMVLRITYLGLVKGKSPLPYKNFKIEVDEDGAPANPTTPQATSAVSQPAAAAGPTTAEIEAAKAMLAGLNQTNPGDIKPVSEYDRLLAILTKSNPKGAAAIKGALESMYPEAEWVQKLKETMTQQGVSF